MGVLRWQLVLQQRIRAALTKAKVPRLEPVQVALELGAVQLLLLDRIPAHAAIFESVELVRQSGNDLRRVGLANAVSCANCRRRRKTRAPADANRRTSAVAGRGGGLQRYGLRKAVETAICRYDQQPPASNVPCAPLCVRPRSGSKDRS